MSISPEAQAIFDWRNEQRKKHRTMTAAEYYAWCYSGDTISHPSQAQSFPGGLTINFGPDAGILGRTSND